MELDGGRLTIDTVGFFVRIGRWRVRLPRLLSLAVRAVETTDDVTPDQIHIDLRVDSPLLGPVFGYAGTFRVEGRPRT